VTKEKENMRKLFALAFASVLVITLASGPVWAKSGWDFELTETGVISRTNTVLEPGRYELRLNGNDEASIYRERKLLTTVPVEVLPLGTGTAANSVLTKSAVIVEIRMTKEVVVFLQETEGTPRSRARGFSPLA
jgi:hypothetical protein